MPELKPCPFCGGEAECSSYQEEHDVYDPETLGFVDTYETTAHHIYCTKCFATSGSFSLKELAIKAWNTRAYEEKNDANV